MTQWILVPLLVVTVALLIRAELSGRRKGTYVWKPISTLLVILVAILGGLTPRAELTYTAWILAALVLSLGGDVALMFTSRRAFLVGLVLFLLAHVALLAGYIRHIFAPGDSLRGLERWVQGIYPFGLLMLVVTQWVAAWFSLRAQPRLRAAASE